MHNIISETWRKLLEEGIPISIGDFGLGLILKEGFDFVLGTDWKIVLCRILIQSIQLGVEDSCLGVHSSDDTTNISNGERVEIYSNDHPN